MIRAVFRHAAWSRRAADQSRADLAPSALHRYLENAVLGLEQILDLLPGKRSAVDGDRNESGGRYPGDDALGDPGTRFELGPYPADIESAALELQGNSVGSGIVYSRVGARLRSHHSRHSSHRPTSAAETNLLRTLPSIHSNVRIEHLHANVRRQMHTRYRILRNQPHPTIREQCEK